MFVRTLTNLLLIGVLLECPFPCLREAAGGIEPASACRCCGDDGCDESGPDRNGPVAPESDGCGTCLCHGAIVEARAAPTTLDFQCFLPPAADDPGPEAVFCPAGHRWALTPSACDFAVVSSGRILRALIASLLI